MSEKQRTIIREISLKGTGLHTGKDVTITFKPAPENTGYIFRRVDLENKPEIKALVDYVVETSRSTVLQYNGASVATVEHVLSAVYGIGIDNIFIEIDGPEMPILDGSSIMYVNVLKEVGLKEQNAERKYFELDESISLIDEVKDSKIHAYPAEELSLNVMIDYNSTVLGNQYACLSSLSDYKTEIAPCKTFVFLKELEILLKNNQIKGGDLTNALVIVDKEFTQKEFDRIADLFHKDHQVYNGRGVLNEKDMVFSNDPARHKLLDLLGDMALAGMPIKGKIIASKPGHFSNIQFVKKIREQIKKNQKKNKIPKYNPDNKPVYDINGIKNILPHRPPFLLVDKIIELTGDYIVGVKNVTMNEPFFSGHFPDEPVMPGVLIVEAMAQTGGILVLNSVDDPENYLTYFMKIDKVRFKKKVVPGDTLIFKLELISPMRRGIANMKAQAFVGENLVTEGELMAQIVKTK
ncbi:MAG: bifunctional UDP-3-O-[3-hydroxymyristoyl] N-acetylglucosamine deacetylase/3-hydroxyacyl-ACP dehydratase [Bacteroidales bacterium]|nr:bifunctional UDP-3-O-[3-hydroxymyristoyl] N-acetylglucosamine deacetylase/3-hydroxyacyl-ACP dehydratase [Bacteroidales bacterium]